MSSKITVSVVIICWNDLKVLGDCLRSIFTNTKRTSFEVILSDNDSTDGTSRYVAQHFPDVRIVANGENLGFARGNNAGIRVSQGRYVLILNPDTVIHAGALDKLVKFAEDHPDAGAFGLRVLNSDGSYQGSARPFPSVKRDLIAALFLRPLARFSDAFISDKYVGWEGDTERVIDWQSGCCVLFRADLLKALGGFDEQFFYHFEEVDLCRRVWDAGYPIWYTPRAVITHLGGQSVNRFPLRFELEKYRSRYRYFYKHFGRPGVLRCRWVVLTALSIRQLGYEVLNVVRPSVGVENRLRMFRAVRRWNTLLHAYRFVETGEEPVLGIDDIYQPTQSCRP